MTPFVGFYPDEDEHIAGVITDCEMMIPSMKGYKGAPSLVPVADALDAACKGSAYVTKLDNTTRLFAGTLTKLYELSGSEWTDVSRAGDYSGSDDSAWRFAQFGDITISVNGADETQYSAGTDDFADLAGAPKAVDVEIIDGFVMVVNYNDGTDTPDGVAWSAYLDYSDWTPSIATQAGNLRLLDTPGECRAVKRLGKYAVVYKKSSMYLGINNGPPLLWGFNLISSEIGAWSSEAVVSIETEHYFISDSDIFMFEGGRPISIGAGIREWFFEDLDASNGRKIRGAYDKAKALIYWYYPSRNSNGALDSCIVYNHKTKKWSRANRDIQTCIEYVTGALTYEELEADYPTYADIPNVSYGSPFWTNASLNMAVFDDSNVLNTLTGESATSSISTGAIGDDIEFTLLSRVQPRFLNDADSGQMTNYYRNSDGSVYTADVTSNMSKNRFDVLRSARWHKLKFDFTGDVELNGATFFLQKDGTE